MIIDEQGRRDYRSQPDGRIIQAVGGASGNLKLINGQTITFPWKAQEEITGAEPPAIQTQEITGITHLLWSTYTGGEFPTVHDRAPYLKFISSFPDASSPSAIADLASGQVAGDAEALIRLASAPTTGQIYMFGETIMIDPLDVNVIDTLGVLDINAGGDLTISTDTAGADIYVTSLGEITLTSGVNYDLNLSAPGTGVINIDGSVFINSVNISTALGQWTNYTPTITQGVAISKTVHYCRVWKFGRTVIYMGNCTPTSSGTSGQVITVDLPYTSAHSGSYQAAGSAYIYANSGNHHCGVLLRSTTSMGFLLGEYGGEFGANPVRQLDSTGTIKWMVVYEATS